MRRLGRLLLLLEASLHLFSSGVSSATTSPECFARFSSSVSLSSIRAYAAAKEVVDVFDRREPGETQTYEKQRYYLAVCPIIGYCVQGAYAYNSYYSPCQSGILASIDKRQRGTLLQDLDDCVCGYMRRQVFDSVRSLSRCQVADGGDPHTYHTEYLEMVRRQQYLIRKRVVLLGGQTLLAEYDKLFEHCVFGQLAEAVKPLEVTKPSAASSKAPAASSSPQDASLPTPASSRGSRLGVFRMLISAWMLVGVIGVAIGIRFRGTNVLSGWVPLVNMDQIRRAYDDDDDDALDLSTARAAPVVPAPSSAATDTGDLHTAGPTASDESVVGPSADAVASLVDGTMVEPSPQSRLNHPD